MTAHGQHSRRLAPPARGFRWLIAGGIASAVAFLFLLPPGAPGYVCPFFALTGHSCFSCGLTRSLQAAIHGDIAAALQYHLMGPLLLALMAAAGLLLACEAWTGRKAPLRKDIARGALLGFGGLWLIFGMVRLGVEVFVR